MFFFHPKDPFSRLTNKLEMIIKGRLWLQAILALALGVVAGIFMGPDLGFMDPARAAVITSWLALPGELFLRLIAMVLIPLLVASIIRGLGGSNDIKKLRSIGLKFFAYIICTTIVASTIGLTMANLVQPGKYVHLSGTELSSSESDQERTNREASSPLVRRDGLGRGEQGQINGIPESKNGMEIVEALPSSIVNLIPENPLRSALEGEMLGVVIFSIIIGIAFAVRSNKKIEPLLGLLDGILEVCMTIVKWALILVPFAVFGLIARMASQVGVVTLLGMGVYVLTVLGGLLILLIFYYLVILIFGRRNPFVFIKQIAPVQLLAFSTSSSAAVIPVSIKKAEDDLDVNPETAEVIVPLGATMNMDGTALYQSVALLFLAQISGIDLSIMQMSLVVLTLVLSSIGAPATPGVGMVILGSVAANLGIPTAGLALIFGVDRIIDMCRTAVNVTGDLTACVVLGKK
ncbi:dicarboxylate/amino acid:cation symporter [Candidatus Peribacteria bacterium]|jgi:Na+/H+-dicarboxylate symporter|nr:dicarboxylate/amino acid:cation symporter [Candidatus Peribacteria bacterium]MBT4240654.1 dicarboxylate/amino acid:cation symporter [Candidatus Peribacteria bacterium]MBT4473750.1 dicarboxylate/amino acid:cation symporter [Candidatus Peribacteria bacterium]